MGKNYLQIDSNKNIGSSDPDIIPTWQDLLFLTIVPAALLSTNKWLLLKTNCFGQFEKGLFGRYKFWQKQKIKTCKLEFFLERNVTKRNPRGKNCTFLGAKNGWKGVNWNNIENVFWFAAAAAADSNAIGNKFERFVRLSFSYSLNDLTILIEARLAGCVCLLPEYASSEKKYSTMDQLWTNLKTN